MKIEEKYCLRTSTYMNGQNLNNFQRLLLLGTIKAKFSSAQKYKNTKKNVHVKKKKAKYEYTLTICLK
jgi:hypothetical protein